jgi:hypothetical protein
MRFYSQLKLSNEFAIQAASLLQRNPVVMKPLSSIEIEYSKYKENLEQEKSRGTFQIGTFPASSQSSSPSELMGPETKIELNENLDAKNLARKLDRKLYFLVKDSSLNRWTLPTTRIFGNEDSSSVNGLHIHAQTNISEILGPSTNLELYHLGPAPVAFHLEKYSDRVVEPFGAKYFIFRSQLISGKVKVIPKFSDFGWFCKEELEVNLEKSLFDSIEPVLSE